MPEPAESSVHTVETSEAAAILFDPRNARFIAPFLGRERLLGEVARELEVPLSTLYRRVAKALQRALHALLETYAQKEGAQRYLLRLNLVPLPEDVELVV